MTTPTPNAASERFMQLCELLPADVHWSDPITPDIVAHIAEAARRTPAAESAARNRAIEECAVAAWSAGMDEYGPYSQLMDPRQVGSICAKRIRTLKAAPTAAQLAALDRLAANAQELGLYDMPSAPTTEGE